MANKSLTKFIDRSLEKNAIVTRDFWETREFYAPGSFNLNKSGFSRSDLPDYAKEILPPSMLNNFTPFLKFSSDKWESVEFVTSISMADFAMFKKNAPKKEIILDAKTDIIYKKDGYLFIVFLRPIEVMQETNGFLDYKEYDKKLVDGKQWLVISKVLLNI